jgi:glycosyltransferase involved in cell wall biosynthesis
LHIGGRDPGYDIKALHDGVRVIVHGVVQDALDFRATHGVNIVPLFSGSGIRIKILEALSVGCPVVSTTLGAEGLSVQHDEHLLIADEATTFARSCIALLQDPQRATAIGLAGRSLVSTHYTWNSAIHSITEFIDSVGPNPATPT